MALTARLACLISPSTFYTRKGSRRQKVFLTLYTRLLTQSRAAKVSATVVQVALIHPLMLLPSIFATCVCTHLLVVSAIAVDCTCML